MSISKIFIPNFVCVLANERYNPYQMGFSFCRLGHAQGSDLGAMGVPRVSKKIIQTWSSGISNHRDDEQKILILWSNW